MVLSQSALQHRGTKAHKATIHTRSTRHRLWRRSLPCSSRIARCCRFGARATRESSVLLLLRCLCLWISSPIGTLRQEVVTSRTALLRSVYMSKSTGAVLSHVGEVLRNEDPRMAGLPEETSGAAGWRRRVERRPCVNIGESIWATTDALVRVHRYQPLPRTTLIRVIEDSLIRYNSTVSPQRRRRRGTIRNPAKALPRLIPRPLQQNRPPE